MPVVIVEGEVRGGGPNEIVTQLRQLELSLEEFGRQLPRGEAVVWVDGGR